MIITLLNLVILISGRGSNMHSILSAIRSENISGVKSILVISDNPGAQGLQVAKNEFNVKTVIITQNDKSKFESELMSVIIDHGFTIDNTLICLAGFMRILGPEFVNVFKNKIINIHPSLLPSFRGLHAQRQALEAGVKVSGCTIHFVDAGIDTGPILIQQCVPVYNDDTEKSLSDRILASEHEAYVKAINLILSNKVTIENNKVVNI